MTRSRCADLRRQPVTTASFHVVLVGTACVSSTEPTIDPLEPADADCDIVERYLEGFTAADLVDKLEATLIDADRGAEFADGVDRVRDEHRHPPKSMEMLTAAGWA